jgi:hypothetical protein
LNSTKAFLFFFYLLIITAGISPVVDRGYTSPALDASAYAPRLFLKDSRDGGNLTDGQGNPLDPDDNPLLFHTTNSEYLRPLASAVAGFSSQRRYHHTTGGNAIRAPPFSL